ncbi:hypothetical protein MATR_24090 [Marivirga tractuosa]|uniref:Uncharacterized protein n=1 Tax=Marivirga tractuosa (strain ATCC 23168 / DSM 4126 / NBRC 15989 / NCIMB 1408 / VKM B-1430 / H-43) TaxID=643867 RepID=E4TR83_MARTH|nr:hypothetical protein [Marivirga tractuosa]ADR23735.1 hypothetical protein Ftrac_3768 [Marivirga tractuosa DSM 4126]BDD15584.1 hypothetical protein MATR_24090 [Marivirga tractuosa]
MRYFLFILFGLFLLSYPSLSQNCVEEITNVKFSSHESNYDLSFDINNSFEYEFSLYDESENRFLIDNSNFRPAKGLESLAIESSGSTISIKAIDNKNKRENLAIIIYRKDKSCEPVKVDLQ